MKRALFLAGLLTTIPAIASADDEPAKATVRVHIVSAKPIRFQQYVDVEWKDVCTSPCDLDLPIDGTYRLTGPDIDRGIMLSGTGVYEIDVDGGSKTLATVGGVTLAAGGIGLLTGLIMVVRGIDHTHLDCERPPPGDYETRPDCDAAKRFAPSERDAGYVTLGVAAAVTAVGIYMFVTGLHHGVTERSAPPPPAPPRDAFVRSPTWRPHAAAPATFPILFEGAF